MVTIEIFVLVPLMKTCLPSCPFYPIYHQTVPSMGYQFPIYNISPYSPTYGTYRTVPPVSIEGGKPTSHLF